MSHRRAATKKKLRLEEIEPSSSESESLSEPDNSSSSDQDEEENEADDAEEPAEQAKPVIHLEVYYDGEVVIEKKRPRPIPVPNLAREIAPAPPKVRSRGRSRSPSPPRGGRRQPARRGAGGLRAAFQRLHDGDLDGFLTAWIILQLLAPAFDLLGNFGQGLTRVAIMGLWRLHWQGNLIVRALTFARINGRCIACNYRRRLTYCFYQRTPQVTEDYFDHLEDGDDGGINLIGLMGTDCFQVKFQLLMRLVDICLDLTHDLHRDDFDQYARARLADILEQIRQAPAAMREVYRNYRNHDDD